MHWNLGKALFYMKKDNMSNPLTGSHCFSVKVWPGYYWQGEIGIKYGVASRDLRISGWRWDYINFFQSRLIRSDRTARVRLTEYVP